VSGRLRLKLWQMMSQPSLQAIKTGDRVKVDADHGIVEISRGPRE